MTEIGGHIRGSVIDVAHEGHVGNLVQSELFGRGKDGILQLPLRVLGHVFVELLCLAKRDADGVYKLVQSVPASILPKMQLGHEVV